MLLLVPAAARAAGIYRSVEGEGLRVTMDAEWGSQLAPGYLPVRFDITNTNAARVIEIVVDGNRVTMGGRLYGYTAARTAIVQTVRLARGDRVRLTVPVPILGDSQSLQFRIREDGRLLHELGGTGFQSGAPADDSSVLIAADTSTPFGRVAAGWPRAVSPSRSGPFLHAAPPSGGAASLPSFDFVLDPARMPTNWLGFTSMRAVFMGPMEWRRLSDEQRSALRTWTACGGDLVLVDGDFSMLPRVGSYSPVVHASGETVPYFLGHVHVVKAETIVGSGLGSVLSGLPSVHVADWALPTTRAFEWGSGTERGFRLPIPGIGQVPARAYLAILLLFSVFIGPVNYLFLARRNRQALVVLTTPLISVVFVVLLATYVVAGEGFGIHGRAVSLTVLDQRSQAAATRASISLYAAGRTPSAGLRFPRDMAILPIGRDGRSSTDDIRVDLSESQRFASGLVRARAPSNYEALSFRTARERLVFARDGDQLTVVNGLGTPVAKLWIRTADRAYSLTHPLAAGGKATLSVSRGVAESLIEAGYPLRSKLAALSSTQPQHSYLALLDHSPFWQPGISGVDERASFHLVLGLVEPLP
ncbi:MAG TPA: hypothetical protein VFV95_18285 [Vicinamibacterales bacterium]|nr:hypothetical protein [Vicinamibacterales bacterium]